MTDWRYEDLNQLYRELIQYDMILETTILLYEMRIYQDSEGMVGDEGHHN